MRKWGIKTIFLIPVIAVLVLFSAGTIHAQSEINIPDWVKNTALWWAEGSLTDQDFVNALQYLITNGIITIPDAATEVIENEPSIDLPYDIDVKFGQATYNSGDTAEIKIETDSPDPQNVKIGIFDSSGDIIYETTVRTNDFGTAAKEFNLPEYYQSDEQLEAIAFFTRDTKDKYTAITLVEGMRITELELDINTKKILSHTPSTVKFALSEAVSKDIMISVFDSDKNSLYMDTVTTNDFGIGKIEFTAPNYYLEDESVEIIASFVDDPSAERKISSTVGFTKTDLTLTSDKTAYAGGDTITITVTTNPPVSTDIILIASTQYDYLYVQAGGDRLFQDGDAVIQTDAGGKYIYIGKVLEQWYTGSDKWSSTDGFHVRVYDDRFKLASQLLIASK